MPDFQDQDQDPGFVDASDICPPHRPPRHRAPGAAALPPALPLPPLDLRRRPGAPFPGPPPTGPPRYRRGNRCPPLSRDSAHSPRGGTLSTTCLSLPSRKIPSSPQTTSHRSFLFGIVILGLLHDGPHLQVIWFTPNPTVPVSLRMGKGVGGPIAVPIIPEGRLGPCR